MLLIPYLIWKTGSSVTTAIHRQGFEKSLHNFK